MATDDNSPLSPQQQSLAGINARMAQSRPSADTEAANSDDDVVLCEAVSARIIADYRRTFVGQIATDQLETRIGRALQAACHGTLNEEPRDG